jgi:hypothetical protein
VEIFHHIEDRMSNLSCGSESDKEYEAIVALRLTVFLSKAVSSVPFLASRTREVFGVILFVA